VTVEELPPLYDVRQAMAADAPAVHAGGNILSVARIKKGDVETAVKQAEAVVSRTYRTPRVEHCYLETEAGISYLEAGFLVLKVGTQNPITTGGRSPGCSGCRRTG